MGAFSKHGVTLSSPFHWEQFWDKRHTRMSLVYMSAVFLSFSHYVCLSLQRHSTHRVSMRGEEKVLSVTSNDPEREEWEACRAFDDFQANTFPSSI